MLQHVSNSPPPLSLRLRHCRPNKGNSVMLQKVMPCRFCEKYAPSWGSCMFSIKISNGNDGWGKGGGKKSNPVQYS